MNLVISDDRGNAIKQTQDFNLDLQYGSKCDFSLALPEKLEAHWRVSIDGTPFGGIIDTPCPSHQAKGSTIKYKGRSLQGVLDRKVLMPPSGKSHYTFKGDANEMIAAVLAAIDADDIFQASDKPSGIDIDYQFNRFVTGWIGLRMALASQGARLKITCMDGKHEISAVPCRTYGSLDSERVFFSLECDKLPVNHLIGLGKGQGTARAIVHWYADILGAVSQTQTLKGVWENALAYQLTSEEAAGLSAKTKAKLLEYQEGSPANVSIPDSVELDIGDTVQISSAEYNLKAITQVVDVVFKHKNGIGTTSYDFGVPDYPEEEE